MSSTTDTRDPVRAWWEMWQQAAESWMEHTKEWASAPKEPPEAWQGLWQAWQEVMQEGLNRVAAATGPGAELAARLLGVLDLWGSFYESWMQAYERAQAEGPQGWFDAITSSGTRKLYEMWRERMDSVADALANLPLASDRPAGLLRAMAAFWEAAFRTGDKMAVPWLEAFDELRRNWTAAVRGDADAFRRFARTWRESYEQSLGKVLRTPALGMAREYIERLARSFDAYLAYLIALQEFLGVLDQVGQDAFKEWTGRLAAMGSREGYPTAKELYRMWVDTFEETYKKVFQTPEYAKLQAEVVRAAVRFKRRFDEAAEDFLKWLPIPTDGELAQMYESFYELKKKVQHMDRELQELKKRVEDANH